MVLKFKVWRLQEEKHFFLVGRGSDYATVYVLRDKLGRIRKIATTMEEKAALRKWYEQYQVGHRLEQFLAVGRLKEHVRLVKQRVRARGFTKQISLYGITKDKLTGKRVYRRYELFKAEKWTHDEVMRLWDLFFTHPPKSHAGVFIYHENRLYVDPEDQVTKLGTEILGYLGERRNPDA